MKGRKEIFMMGRKENFHEGPYIVDDTPTIEYVTPQACSIESRQKLPTNISRCKNITHIRTAGTPISVDL